MQFIFEESRFMPMKDIHSYCHEGRTHGGHKKYSIAKG
jgi:hypothetical protein